MKILQIITSLRIGGAEKLITDMVPLFIKEGHTVDVLLFDGIETSFRQQLLNQNIKIISLGVNTFVYNPLLIFKLIPIIKQYDIVHTHNTACQYFTALAKLISHAKTKLVTTEHSSNNRRRSIPFFRFIDKLIYHQYDAIIPISQQACDNLKKSIGNLPTIHIIPNGISVKSYAQANALNRKDISLSESDFLITMVAGFRTAKDQDTIIRSLKYLPSTCKLLLVGDGERRKILEDLAISENIKDRVIFLGIRSDIPAILKTSDLVIMSSHWEGLSLSSLEGMSSGKPFIASDVDGLHETVNEYGILFPEGNDKALSEIILKLMTDKTLYTNIAQKCQKRAEEFDIQKTVNYYLNAYQKILHNHNSK